MTKAYGYIRCSGLGQMSADGPVRQLEAITHFCRAHQIELVHVYEESHTGGDLEGRTEFHKMREAMLANGVRMVICEKLDRIARSIMVQETILADFKKHGIELRSATPGEDDLCGDDPTRTLIRQILGCFFEYERKMIELKLRAARERERAKNGVCEGRKAYPRDANEAAVYSLMLSYASEGSGVEKIARKLNEAGIKTRYGKLWHPATISKILARSKEAV